MNGARAVGLLVATLLGCEPEPLGVAKVGLVEEAGRAANRAAGAASSVATTSLSAQPPVRGTPDPPPGYVTMQVQAHSAPASGEAVLLVDEEAGVVVPIFVGGTEALSIRLRLEERRFQRPLTHDLLDALARQLGARLLRVQVDELVGNVFVGSVVFQHGDRLVQLDARPSDAVALAVGNGVPVYVSRQVVAAAGIPTDSLGRAEPERSSEPVAL